MVDAQFVEDKYVDVEERNREAVEERNRRAAERAASQPAPKTKAQKLSERAQAIQAAGKKAEHGGRIELKEFSKFTPNGEIISIAVKRITPQELLAGDLLPTTARKMVSHFVEIGTRATAGERRRVGLEEVSGQQVIDEVFEGDTLLAAEAYTSLIDSICIACVRDPEIRLYWNEKAKGDDQYGLVISVIPFPDREAIAAWALNAEEAAAKTVEPFLQRPASPPRPVSAVERWDGQAERADEV